MEVKKKRKKWPIVLLVIVIIVALAALGLNYLGTQVTQTLQGASIEEVSAKTGSITSAVTATGNIAAGKGEVYVPYGVEIGAIDVEVGDYVVAGERVARIDSYSITEEKEKTEDDIKKVDKKIEEEGEHSGLTLLKDTLQKKMDALNSLNESKALYASTNGIITKVNVSEWTDVNRPVQENNSNSMQDPSEGSGEAQDSEYTEISCIAFEITPSDKYSITINVDELDILSVQVGHLAKVTMDALPGEEFEATVEKIHKETTALNGVVKYSVQLVLPKSDDIRIGMNASVEIATEKAENIIILPAFSIQEEGGEQFVYTTKEADGKLSGKTLIETGLSDGIDVEVKTGLNAGDKVYYNVKITSQEDVMTAFGGPGISAPTPTDAGTSEGGAG